MARVIVRLIPIVLLGLAWEAFAPSGAVAPFMLPPLSAVALAIWSEAVAGDLARKTGLTLYRALAGFFIAAGAGVALGCAMSRSALVRWFFDPIISVGFPMPKIAFLPIVILWLGFFDVSKIAMVVFDAIFPVVTATIAGLQGVERELIWSARNMGANGRALLWQILLPAALPQILTGLQVALPLSLIVAVVAEMGLGGYGPGGALMTSSRFPHSRGAVAGIVEIGAVGFCLVKAMSMLRPRPLFP